MELINSPQVLQIALCALYVLAGISILIASSFAGEKPGFFETVLFPLLWVLIIPIMFVAIIVRARKGKDNDQEK